MEGGGSERPGGWDDDRSREGREGHRGDKGWGSDGWSRGGATPGHAQQGVVRHTTLEPLFVSGSKLSSTGVGCVLQAGLPRYCEMQVTPVERVPGRVSVVFTGVQRRVHVVPIGTCSPSPAVLFLVASEQIESPMYNPCTCMYLQGRLGRAARYPGTYVHLLTAPPVAKSTR